MNFNSHAHVERDIKYSLLNLPYFDFNSHAHVERDYFVNKFGERDFYISTHTLTWSVTKALEMKDTEEKDFNSHAHVERDI